MAGKPVERQLPLIGRLANRSQLNHLCGGPYLKESIPSSAIEACPFCSLTDVVARDTMQELWRDSKLIYVKTFQSRPEPIPFDTTGDRKRVLPALYGRKRPW